MANVFKNFMDNDMTTVKSLLHEAIPITGSLVSGTYSEATTGSSHVKTYSHGMYESVYDYPYLSASSNHLFDITVGVYTGSALGASVTSQRSTKANIYSQLAQTLMGFDATGSVNLFDADGDLTSGTKLHEVIFLSFSRLLVKDEIKKGSFVLELGVSGNYDTPFTNRVKIKDTNAQNDYRTNSPVGEYGVLYITNSVDTQAALSAGEGVNGDGEYACGLLFYQAGVAVLSGSIFSNLLSGSIPYLTSSYSNPVTFAHTLTGSTITVAADAFRRRFYDLDFNNTTELNSAIYFCRANHNEFNYSSNPTYTSNGKIRVKNTSTDLPVTYITTVGLYSPDNECLAVAKLSEPIKKSSDSELILRVRLDG